MAPGNPVVSGRPTASSWQWWSEVSAALSPAPGAASNYPPTTEMGNFIFYLLRPWEPMTPIEESDWSVGVR
jgi:hypothetical protein